MAKQNYSDFESCLQTVKSCENVDEFDSFNLLENNNSLNVSMVSSFSFND